MPPDRGFGAVVDGVSGDAGACGDARQRKRTGLFAAALGLERPWYVERTEFDPAAKRLDIHLNFEPGGVFPCRSCGLGGCKAYDTKPGRWRHLNFFQHEAYLHAPSPRVRCPECGVRQAGLPWARPRSGFTLLFEALVVQMACGMPVAVVARLAGEHDTRLWRIIKHYVDQALAEAGHSGADAVGVDEKVVRRGHDYVTLFADLKRRRLLHATPGRKAGSFAEFKTALEAHGGKAEQVRELCMDMSKAYRKGAREHFPAAGVTFDRFHVAKLLNEAVDAVRRREQKHRAGDLRKTRWLWLRNRESLSASQRARLDELLDPHLVALDTARAYQLKLSFQEFWELPYREAQRYLDRWCDSASACGLEPMTKLARTIRNHRTGILRWLNSRISNGLLEAMNSLIQDAKVRARGYRTTDNFITMAYLVCGKLSFNLPT